MSQYKTRVALDAACEDAKRVAELLYRDVGPACTGHIVKSPLQVLKARKCYASQCCCNCRRTACKSGSPKLPIGSIVVPFWGLPYRILNFNHKEGTTMEPIGRLN